MNAGTLAENCFSSPKVAIAWKFHTFLLNNLNVMSYEWTSAARNYHYICMTLLKDFLDPATGLQEYIILNRYKKSQLHSQRGGGHLRSTSGT